MDAGVLDMLQERLGTLAGRDSGYIATLPPQVKNRLKALQKLQKEHESLSLALEREYRELETKYRKKYHPRDEQRQKIVSGEHEPTEAECAYEGKDAVDKIEEPVHFLWFPFNLSLTEKGK